MLTLIKWWKHFSEVRSWREMYLQMFFTQLPKVISQIGTISVSHTILSLQHSGRIFFFFQRKRIDCPLFHSNWNKWCPSRIFTPKLYSQWLMRSKVLTPSPDCDVLNCCKYSLKYFISKDPLISIKVINSFKHIWTNIIAIMQCNQTSWSNNSRLEPMEHNICVSQVCF